MKIKNKLINFFSGPMTDNHSIVQRTNNTIPDQRAPVDKGNSKKLKLLYKTNIILKMNNKINCPI